MTLPSSLLPDEPRWIEARGMLASGRGAPVRGCDEDPATLIAAQDAALAVVVDWRHPAALSRALGKVPRDFTILAPPEAASAVSALLAERSSESATLFVLTPDKLASLALPEAPTRLLGPVDGRFLRGLDPALRRELEQALTRTVVCVCLADGRPVSFCHAAWETESRWDVSIDTLEGWRRKGLARAAVLALTRHFRDQAKSPVWGALDSNRPSHALAHSLGFEPVDRLVLFHPA